jgi:hypothetical protein
MSPLLPKTAPNRLGAAISGMSLASFMVHVTPACGAATEGQTGQTVY